MKRLLCLAACAAIVAAPAARAADSAAVPKLSAAQIVDKNVRARGGLSAWRAVNALSMAGRMDAGGKVDTQLPFTLTLQRPHKSRLEIRFLNQPAVQVYDGKQGWKLRPYLNRNDVEPYTATEARLASEWDELDGPLIDHARKGVAVELAGVEKVDGKPAYKLKLKAPSGAQRMLWVDAGTFLEVKIDGTPRKLDGRMHKVAVYYRDFRPEGALVVPHELDSVVEGVKPARKLVIESVTLNPKLEASTFARPDLRAGQSAAQLASSQ